MAGTRLQYNYSSEATRGLMTTGGGRRFGTLWQKT